MKAMQREIAIPQFTENDAIIRDTLLRIHVIMWKPNQSPARRIINKAKLDQLILHLMAAPEFMLPSC